MHDEFTAVFERDGDWVIAYCPVIPGANGQGRTKEEARASLIDAIALILAEPRRRLARRAPRGRTRDGHGAVKRSALLRHLRQHGCVLKREGG